LLRKRANNSPAMDVARVHCPWCCGSSGVLFVSVQMIFAVYFWFEMFDCFQTLNKHKINPSPVQELEGDMLTVSQNTNH
jgi:hypothetical protein